ncbi:MULTISPECIES: transposase [Blautia]|uniref:transposase n=2 Tax=Blautia producta TaxID=33035 RepID=UPI002D80D120|nr:transposase [Blautia producta]
MINDLKKMIKTLQATVDAANKREEALTQERDNLKEEIDLLRKKLFGTSSEKRTLDIPGQLNFFNEAELEQDPKAAKAEDLEALLPEKTEKNEKQELQMLSVLKVFQLKKSIWTCLRKTNSVPCVVLH